MTAAAFAAIDARLEDATTLEDYELAAFAFFYVFVGTGRAKTT